MDEEEGAKLEGREDLLESNNFDEIGSEKKKKKKKKKKGKKRRDDKKDKKSNLVLGGYPDVVNAILKRGYKQIKNQSFVTNDL